MSKRNSDPAVAQRVVDSIFERESAEARRSYCKFLGKSIAYLSQRPDRWGITLLDDKDVVRLNAGIVEALVLSPGRLRILVHKETAPPGTSFDGHIFRNAPECETAAIPLSDLPRALPALAESHHKALTIAADRRPSWRGILTAHSTGVTKWLSQVLRREVPNPAKPRRPLHVVQGGIENSDKALIERLARGSQATQSWVKFLSEASLDELRKVALLKANSSLSPRKQVAIRRAKSQAIRRYVLKRAGGRCEGCSSAAPFLGTDGQAFLETHHTARVADDGPDDPRTVIAICPNCHSRAHYAEDAKSFNAALIRKLPKLEADARKR